MTDEMRDGQLRLSREAAELADRADRGEAVDADELSGIDKDRARSRRPAVLRRLHAIDATRVHLTMKWVVFYAILSAFGPL